MSILRRPYAYTKMEAEDPEEVMHIRAQLLIYKVLQQVDSGNGNGSGRRRSWLRIRISKLKIKIGRRLKKIRKTILLRISAAKVGAYKQVVGQLRTWKRIFGAREATYITLPPVFS